MDDDELRLNAKALLLKIHVIVGWVVPEDEMKNILTEQFKYILKERYALYNSDEVEYAFRNIGPGVEDWGKVMNLQMIDRVMYPYMQQRSELSKIEEQEVLKQKQIEYKEGLSDLHMLDWWNEVKWKVQTQGFKMEFISIDLYAWKDRRGEILATKKDKKEYLAKASDYRFGILVANYESASTEENKIMLSNFKKMREGGCATGDEASRLIDISKKMIVYDMMKNASDATAKSD